MAMMLRSADWYHHLPAEVKEILSRLGQAGHTTYVVGGAVRDLLLSRTPKDFDLVSSAKPADVAALFEKTLEIGKQFGISMVVVNGATVEVATFRKESTYSDGRHPDRIEYATPEEDALRRDFTINGLFWDPEQKQVIDYVGGLSDIEGKRIQCIGDASARFHEDALRMLRALRFFSSLQSAGFSLDTSVIEGIKQCRERIKKVSRERITEEMGLLLKARNPSAGLDLCAATRLWHEMFPNSHLDAGMISRLDALTGDKWLGLALCVDNAEAFLKVFVLGRDALAQIRTSLQLIARFEGLLAAPLAEQKYTMIEPAFDAAATTAREFFYDKPKLTGAIATLISAKVKYQREGTLNPEPLINGEDLRNAGITPGPSMGMALKKIRAAQLNEEISTKEEALDLIKT